MSLYIKNPEVDTLARKLAKREGVSVTQLISRALKDREAMAKGARLSSTQHAEKKKKHALKILNDVWKMPVKDTRTADEILGYNTHGVFD